MFFYKNVLFIIYFRSIYDLTQKTFEAALRRTGTGGILLELNINFLFSDIVLSINMSKGSLDSNSIGEAPLISNTEISHISSLDT